MLSVPNLLLYMLLILHSLVGPAAFQNSTTEMEREARAAILSGAEQSRFVREDGQLGVQPWMASSGTLGMRNTAARAISVAK